MRYKWLIILLCVLMTACEGETKVTRKGKANSSGRGAPQPGVQPTPQTPPGPAVNTIAPNITGVDLDGKEFQLEDYRGKVVMLDFWGDW